MGSWEQADKASITSRYQAMMKQLQPGEDGIARKLNAAKDLLLGK